MYWGSVGYGLGWIFGRYVYLAVAWVGSGQLFGELGWSGSIKINQKTIPEVSNIFHSIVQICPASVCANGRHPVNSTRSNSEAIVISVHTLRALSAARGHRLTVLSARQLTGSSQRSVLFFDRFCLVGV